MITSAATTATIRTAVGVDAHVRRSHRALRASGRRSRFHPVRLRRLRMGDLVSRGEGIGEV
ncbi:hypothetical protein [Rhodopseudomonas sp. P2A-2r]|uniref:hypothetical protein n=1 Tax=unclassified Rhodopseudomonas TaxID=2638247 RepID=UPI0022344523|nr:hypothetical protein [Rhodopseudomonas sp. P2A-2r]UZE46661.1 hypothetical protein ONR75_16400 [Rhodopseudomonas sp. P2A-2r]